MDNPAARSFGLAGTSGHDQLTCTLLGILSTVQEPVFLCSLDISGRTYPRESNYVDGPIGDWIDDYSVEFLQVLIRRRILEDFKSSLVEWLDSAWDREPDAIESVLVDENAQYPWGPKTQTGPNQRRAGICCI